jgi:hypothetical protein
MVIAPVAALALLAPTVGRAAEVPVSAYKFSAPICAKDALEGANLFQVGDLNNKGQFTVNMATNGEERIYLWDGTKVVPLSDTSINTPDGRPFSVGNVWSPHGINDAGVVAWVADVDGGDHIVLTYDAASGKYALIAKPGQPAPGGGEFLNGGTKHGPSHRQAADINNKGQVVWNQPVAGADGEPHNAIFMFDPATQQPTAIMRPGTTAPGGGAFDQAWVPQINEKSQVAFIASKEGSEQYGLYLWDAGTITPIAAPGDKIGEDVVDQAGYPRLAENGDIVFVTHFGEGHTAFSEGTTDETNVVLYTAADKKLQTLLKPGDALPDGKKFHGVELNRRPVALNSQGQVVVMAIREEDSRGGMYLWQSGNLQLLTGYGETIPGVGKVTGMGKSTEDATGGTWDGYHTAINENGDIAFSAQVDGIPCFVLATAPKAEPAPAAGS